jgi:hypothetical protein
MSAESCPEPMPYSSNNNYMADIDFTEPPMAVFTAQPKFAEVDSILAQQLGPTTNPVTTNEQPELSGSPVLPVVNQSNAMPVSSNVVGADINAPTTLVQEFQSTLAVNDVNSDVSTSAGLPMPQMESIPQPTPQSRPEPLGESFKNINKLKVKSKSNSNTNLANFISSKEHFGNRSRTKVRTIEHFNTTSVLDNVVLFIVITAGVFYLYTLSPLYHPLDVSMAVSQIPFVGSLTDSSVSDNNKLMIVAGILIAVVVVFRLIK